jgi:hypothetical protein
MPFSANYYTVCATIGTINKFFENFISKNLKNNNLLFKYLKTYQTDFLFKLIESIKNLNKKNKQSIKIYSNDGSEESASEEEVKAPQSRLDKFKELHSKRKRIPNKQSKQRSKFLIKSAFKLELLKARICQIKKSE